MNYNESQNRAICHRDGPCLVLAGPGSGKTAVLTARIAKLIEEGVSSSSILVITFTRASAGEMRDRFLRKQIPGGNQVTFGTFHAIFFQILMQECHMKSDCIISDREKRKYLRDILKKIHLETEDSEEVIKDFISDFSRMKNLGLNPEEMETASLGQEKFVQLAVLLKKKMKQEKLIDFDDMQTMCLELFQTHPETLKTYQSKYKYILIDEFQDINPIQYRIVGLMAQPENNLFVVGDDDQSIYGFRGSKPDIMLDFPKVYPGASRILLDVNYRSDYRIVEAGLKLISHNKKRYEKRVEAFSENPGRVFVDEYESQVQEAKQVAEKIEAYLKEDWSFQDLAVIYRASSMSHLLMDQLIDREIPYRTKEPARELTDHWVGGDILAYLRLAEGNLNRKDFLLIMNHPYRGIGREILDGQNLSMEKMLSQLSPASPVYEKLLRLSRDLQLLGRMKPGAAIQYIRFGMGYEDFLRRKGPEGQELIGRLEEIHREASAYPSLGRWLKAIENRKENAEKTQEDAEGVTLTTMHGSKGLEYSVVFILGVNEGLIPYKRAQEPEEIEEERRMFFVAITRAKRILHLSYTKSIRNHASLPSVFLGEILED